MSTSRRFRFTPWSSPGGLLQRQEVHMKQIRGKVGGLDVHRDTVVACTRVTMPSGEVEVAKEAIRYDPRRVWPN